MTETKAITVQVLNGATGEIREVVANVSADDEQSAVEKLFSHARRDDYYYRFLGSHSLLVPASAVKLSHSGLDYYARE